MSFIKETLIAIIAVIAIAGGAILYRDYGPQSVPAALAAPAPAPAAGVPAKTAEATPAPAPEAPKTMRELVTEAEADLSDHHYKASLDSFDLALEKVNPRSQEAVPLLLKQGEANLGNGTTYSAQVSYRQALANLEREFGPDDPRILPALAGLIVSYDASVSDDDPNAPGENDPVPNASDALKLTLRYKAIAQAQPLVAVDSKKDEAAVAAYVQQAMARAKESDSCPCEELEASIKDAETVHGPRSYVVALLWLKRAEVGDQAKDAEPVDESQLLDVLAISEQNLGPLDARLAPALKQLIAFYDQSQDHNSADVYKQRLDLLNKPAN